MNKLKEFFKSVFKKRPKPWPTNIYDLNGSVYFFDFKDRVVVGHMYDPIVGEGIRCKMESGKKAVFRITEVRRCNDPRNMWFADVEDVGYET